MQKKYPFKFLDSYQKEDKDFFFGRSEEINHLYEMIFQTKILLIFGTSGTGKTSLIKCGLANKFETYDWLALNIRRGANLVASLDKALCEISAGAFTFTDQINEDYNIKELSQKIRAVYDASLRPLYLIFDQFEEIYVKGLGTKTEQENFIKVVKEILAIEQPVKIIISIREEYLGYLYEFEKEVPQLLRKKLRIESMTLDKLTKVVEGIKSYHDNFNSVVDIKSDEINEISIGIFERLKGKDRNALTIQLPYLQVFLDKLYMQISRNDEMHQTDVLINLIELDGIGNFEDVLQDFLEEQVKVISRELSTKKNKVTPETIWSILSGFCSLEGTKEPISKEKLLEDLQSNLNKNNLIDKSIEAFQKSRIIKKSDEEDLYELYHDTLALKIVEKRSEDDISKLEVTRLIKSRAALPGNLRELFTEKQLNFIEPYEHKIASKLSDDEKKLILDSKKAVRRSKLRKRALVIFGIMAITFTVAYFGIKGSIELEENKITQDISKIKTIITAVQLLTNKALIQEDKDPTISLQFGREAMKKLKSIDSTAIMDSLHKKNYGFFSKLPIIRDDMAKYKETAYEEIDFKEDSLNKVLEIAIDSILSKDNAFYNIVKQEINFDSSFVNFIFPDRKIDSTFKIWNGTESLQNSIKGHGKLIQVVFPRDSAETLFEAMALYSNGVARYWGKNPNYKKLNLKENDKITSISPVHYTVIGYKMLTAMNNKRIVEWNLNGTQRYNYHDSVKTDDAVIYKIRQRDVKLNENIVSIAITSNRKKMFTASDKGIGTIWEANTSTIDLSTDSKNAFNLYQEAVLCSAFSNDGTMIATGSKDHKVKIWSAATGNLIKELKGHSGPVTSVAFSASDIILYTSSTDGAIRKWLLGKKDPITKTPSSPWNKVKSFDSIFSEKIIDTIPYKRRQVMPVRDANP